MQLQALPGFRDFFPADFALRSHIFGVWRNVAHRYGFEEYDGPPLEPLELYTAKSGDEIVGQLYHFEDKGGRAVSLRPEMTPTLARMVAARANGLRKPIRWFAIPQLFRYERQQRGRLREHFQLNCDLIGEAGPLADAEIIALAVDVIRALGLSEEDVRVRLSDRRLLGALLMGGDVAEVHLPTAFAAIDKLERTPRTELGAQLTKAGCSAAEVARVFAVAGLKGREAVLAAADAVGASAIAESVRQVLAALDAMDLGRYVDLDLTIVRGLAYYTGTVFELFDAGKAHRAICGGGRYDTLVGALGGVDLPCVGFGMGDVVLSELLKDRALVPSGEGRLDVFIATVTDEDRPQALKLAHELRDAALSVEYALASQKLGKQLEQASARGARFAIVIGPDDRAKGEVQVKDLAARTQVAVRREAVVAALQS
jgi:histidyl-tRNA synthetase